MNNRTIVLIGLVLLTILAWFCTSGHFAQWNALRSATTPITPATQAIVAAQALPLDVSATWDNLSKFVVLRGSVPSDQSKQTIAAAARAQYGADRVKDELSVSTLAPLSAGLQGSLAAFPPDLKGYIAGAATLNGSGLRIVGTLPDEVAKTAASQAAALWVAQRHAFELDLKALHSPVTAEVKATAQAHINKALELDYVEFRTGSAELTDKGIATLQRILPALRTVSAAGFEIAGHTDNQGKTLSNQALSEARANTVKDYLAKQGIAASQRSTKGFGATKPKANNATKEGRAHNRRIEFNIR
jgi:OmpA-OmpF porin, OOP family